MNLKGELRSCQLFLVDSQLERARHIVLNYKKENLLAKTVKEKRNKLLKILRRTAKVNLAFGFFLKNKDNDGFSCLYTHEVSTLLYRLILMCTNEEMANLEDIL